MKPITAILAVVGIAAAVIILFLGRHDRTPAAPPSAGNVSIVDGTQIVTLQVKGGYRPILSQVKSGIPTVLRFETDATYDCSSSIRIPNLGISRNLPPSGATDVALGTLAPGTLQGTCGMGMYRFSLEAKS